MSVVESKSLLAKLLAEENITVQHRKTQTAYFDIKQRILVCPILKDMPAELYDLLMGHEVGHALYTPLEGWHNAVTQDQRPNFKSFLNIVEDARIERFVKNKFPGIRSSFYKGYQNLFDRDFFGVANVDIATLKLIDRINLHFKLGVLANASFSDEEMVFVRMVEEAKTWDDVVRAASALYEYAKNEQAQTDTHQSYELSDEDGDGDDFEFDLEDGEPGAGKDEFEDDADIFEDARDFAPDSMTDKSFRRREQELVDESCVPIAYVNLPSINLAERVIPHSVVYQNMVSTIPHFTATNTFKDLESIMPGSSIRDFNAKNGRYVNYLVKEFELRKNAKQFARASINKTGELDMQKIGKYRLTEDLFRRVTVVPQGKNHGLILFLDMSGSMQHNMAGTIEQLLILTMFCRKVNIPFAVYGFIDSSFDDRKSSHDHTGGFNKTMANYKEGDLYLENETFRLREYLTSSMTRNEYNDAVSKLLVIMELYRRGMRAYMPSSERLNGTPLDEAIVASIEITNKFRKAHRLEVLTTMFLTDGESSCSPYRYVTDVEENSFPTTKSFRAQTESSFNYNLIITDPKSRESVSGGRDSVMTTLLLKLAKKATGANYIGFFIGQPGVSIGQCVRKVMDIYRVKGANYEKDLARARKDKYFPVLNSGFDVYYVVPGGDELTVKDTGINVPVGAAKNDLRKAFLATMSSRAVNRVFLSRFCNTLCQSL